MTLQRPIYKNISEYIDLERNDDNETRGHNRECFGIIACISIIYFIIMIIIVIFHLEDLKLNLKEELK